MRLMLIRRPEIFLLLSLLLFGGTLAARWAQSQEQSAAQLASPALESIAVRGAARDAGDAAAALQDYLRDNPGDSAAYAQLGSVYLQLARNSGDPSYYSKAGEVFQKALDLDNANVEALSGMGTLALARHQFAEAHEWGLKARELNPYRAQILGIIGDAEVELGRYAEAVQTIQQMVDTRPDLSSYSRVSYLRELHGDVPGAIQAMQQAAQAGGPAAENTAWVTVQLGHLYFNSGDLQSAEREYKRALAMLPNYVHGLAGLGRVQAARGDDAQAIASYKAALEIMPLAEFAIALGDVYERAGMPQEAADQRALVRAMQQLNAANGMDVELELALFDVDLDQNLAQALASARAAYERRPGIHAADTLAWALFKNGQLDEARHYSQEALRLGTRDALLHYHAGRIAEAQGDSATAREHYQTALQINPYFSLRYAADARAWQNCSSGVIPADATGLNGAACSIHP